MDHYIIRIYRRGEKASDDITGIAEEVETEVQKAFRNSEELIRILSPGGESEQQRGREKGVEELVVRAEKPEKGRKVKK